MIDQTPASQPALPELPAVSRRQRLASLTRRLRTRQGLAEPPLRVAIIGHLKYPIAAPFMGGLERFLHTFVTNLQDRGVDVTLFAAAGSDESLNIEPIVPQGTIEAGLERFPDDAQAEQRLQWMEDHEDRAFEKLMHRLTDGDLAGWFDVVHNNSINPIPLRHADGLSAPCTTTLHVPVLPRLETELAGGGPYGSFVNISKTNADGWARLLPRQLTITNSVDTDVWTPQPLWRRRRAVWFGRIHPDKGTHLAIEAAHRLGLPIDIAGPKSDPAYYRDFVEPAIQRSRGDRLLGPCETETLRKVVARASVCFVTPCWDEPFGLVAAEAMSCGTPVAAFARGGPIEIIDDQSGRLATPGDVDDLVRAARQCLSLDRGGVRESAVSRFRQSLMIDRYIEHYEQLAQVLPRIRTGSPAVPNTGLEKQIALA